MANMKIIDLSTGSPDSTSYIESTQANSQAPGGRVTIKVNLAELGNWIAGQGNSPLGYQDLNTDSDTLIDAINELLVYAMNIAAEYDPTATYAVGDFCLYQGVLYKCTTAITVAEAWNSAHWTSTLISDEFGSGGGGASVTLGTTVPSDASGENGDLYVQYDSSTYAVIEYFVKINNSWRKAPYSRVVALTQSEYSQITPDPTTLYIITDAQSSYQTKTDNGLDTDATTIVGGINELHDSIGADVFDPNASYTVGMYCIYNNTLYRCKESTSGAWDSTKWEAKTITSLLESLNCDSFFENDSDTITSNVSKNVLEKALTSGIYSISFTVIFQSTEDNKSLFLVIRQHTSPNTAYLSQSMKSLSGDFSSMDCSGVVNIESDQTIDFRVGNKLSANTNVTYRISIIKLR